jgi:hypothetical protein
MMEPFESYEEVCEAALELEQLKQGIEFQIINGDPPERYHVIELLTLAEDMMAQLKFEFAP